MTSRLSIPEIKAILYYLDRIERQVYPGEHEEIETAYNKLARRVNWHKRWGWKIK